MIAEPYHDHPEEQTQLDIKWMKKALVQAQEAGEHKEVPVGALVVYQEQQLAACGNRREALLDPTAHAEVLALKEAAKMHGSWRLTEATLYVTQEPCLMCAGALLNARIKRLVYGCENPKAGAVKTLYQVLQDYRLNHQIKVQGGILASECALLLNQFFQDLRRLGKK